MQKISSRGEQLDQISINAPKVSGFDISSDNNGTCKIGYIVPTRCRPCLPGDTLKGSERVVLNFEPLAVDLMSNMYYKSEKFLVPWRLLWHNFPKWYDGKQKITGSEYTPPQTSLKHILYVLLQADLLPFYKYIPSGSASNYSSKDAYITHISNNSFADGNVDLYFQFANLFDVYDAKFIDLLELLVPIFLKFPSDNNIRVDSASDLLNYFSIEGNLSISTFIDLFLSTLSSADGISANEYTIALNTVAKMVCIPFEFAFDVIDLLFGTSSLFDYLNAPCIDAFRWKNDFVNYVVPKVLQFTDSIPGYSDLVNSILGFLTLPTFYNVSKNIFEGDGVYLLDSDVIPGVYSIFIPDLISFSLADVPYTNSLAFGTPQSNSRFIYFDDKQFLWLPFRANYWCWYYNYRDKILETMHIDPEDYVGDTVSDIEIYEMVLLRPRAWSKDTFTTALPDTGSGNVYVPQTSNVEQKQTLTSDVGSADVGDNDISQTVALNGVLYRLPSKYLSNVNGESNSIVDFGISVDNINRAKRLARFLQKELILSNDYSDVLFSHWAVKMSDKSLHRPEWLDGQSEMITINPILNNTTTEQQDAGTKVGLAFASGKSDGFERFVEELSFELSYLSIMPYQSYPFGLPRYWNIVNRFDVPWPEFADLGLDAVYNEELQQFNGVPISIDNVDNSRINAISKMPYSIFGYQGRYYDYKSQFSEVHGRLKTDMKEYTFGRYFDYLDESSAPKLNYIFIHCFPYLDAFVVNDKYADLVRYSVIHSTAVSRRLPVASTEVY